MNKPITGTMENTPEIKEPRIGVAAIIERKGKVLLIKRKGAHGAGSWAVPGGHLEFGESPEDCAVRETREEVGIEISDVRFIAITNDIFPEAGRHYITIWMRGTCETGEPGIAAENEVAEVGWYSWDNLPAPLFLPLKNLLHRRGYPQGGFLNI
jgi:8-oxo-dGTP diphosphatase